MATLENHGGLEDGVVGKTASHDRNGLVGGNEDITPRNAFGAGGNGVFGFTAVPDGSGLFGAHTGTGVGVGGLGSVGVSGGSFDGVGVVGISAPPGGKGGDGVRGVTNSEQRNGVFGTNLATGAHGSADPRGNGVLGYSAVPDGAGVFGLHGGKGAGVLAVGDVGLSAKSWDPDAGTAILARGGFGVKGIGKVMGVWGIADGSGWAGYFTGPVKMDATGTSGVWVEGTFTSQSQDWEAIRAETDAMTASAVAIHHKNPDSPYAALYVRHARPDGPAARFDGDVFVTGDIILANAADCAEDFDVVDPGACEPGTLMVLTDGGALEPCSSAYDRRVAGVVSGAEGFRPGIILDKQPGREGRVAVALMGKVYCKADAGYGAIAVGDLLTTSPTAGHAMRAADPSAAFGAVIGKAMAPLADGRALVPVLIALQ